MVVGSHRMPSRMSPSRPTRPDHLDAFLLNSLNDKLATITPTNSRISPYERPCPFQSDTKPNRNSLLCLRTTLTASNLFVRSSTATWNAQPPSGRSLRSSRCEVSPSSSFSSSSSYLLESILDPLPNPTLDGGGRRKKKRPDQSYSYSYRLWSRRPKKARSLAKDISPCPSIHTISDPSSRRSSLVGPIDISSRVGSGAKDHIRRQVPDTNPSSYKNLLHLASLDGRLSGSTLGFYSVKTSQHYEHQYQHQTRRTRHHHYSSTPQSEYR